MATSGGGLMNTAVAGLTATLSVENSQILSNTTDGTGAAPGTWPGGAGIFTGPTCLTRMPC